MNNFNWKIIVGIAVVIILVLGVVIYLFVFTDDNTAPTQTGYPESVQNVIDNPIERNENWSTIIDDSDYQVSYSSTDSTGTFYITVNNYPIGEVASKAEQALVAKLAVDQAYLCSLPVIINVPSSIDDNLSQYNFGLSFCPDRIHLSDFPEQQSEQPTQPAAGNANLR